MPSHPPPRAVLVVFCAKTTWRLLPSVLALTSCFFFSSLVFPWEGYMALLDAARAKELSPKDPQALWE